MRQRGQGLLTLLVTCLSVLSLLTAGLYADNNERTLLNALQHSTNLKERKINLNNLYRFYKNKKVLYLAQTYLEKLIQLHQNQSDFPALEKSLANLGEIFEEKQEYQAALEVYFQALTYSSKNTANQRGAIYLRIAEVFRIINRLELAKKYLKKALDYTIRHHDRDLKVFVLRSYSNLYYEQEDYTNALKFIDLSLETEKGRRKYLCTIQCLYQKAMILFKIGEIEVPGAPLSQNPKLDDAMSLLKTAVDKGLKEQKYDRLLKVLGAYIEKLIRLH
jgi:tetratricopeptide (TPR) repeat protein